MACHDPCRPLITRSNLTVIQMEKTLIIFKPDCLNKKKLGAVIDRFEQAGFALVGCKMLVLSDETLVEHYAHLAELPFFPEIKEFMSSIPVVIAIFQGNNAVERIRELVGPTDSNAAPAGTIRGDWGTDKMLNIVHASDSPEASELEIKRFFADGEVFGG